MHSGKKPTAIVEPATAQFPCCDFSHAIAQEHFFQGRKPTVRKTLKKKRLVFAPSVFVRIGVREEPGPLAHPCRMGKWKSPPWSPTNGFMGTCRGIAADDLAFALENHGPGSQQINVAMFFKELHLPFKALRIRYVVGIHSGDILSPRKTHTLIQP